MQNLCITGCFLLEEVTLTYEQLRGYYLVIVAIEGYALICLATIFAILLEEDCPVTWLLLYSTGGILNLTASAYLFMHCDRMKSMHFNAMNEVYVVSVASFTLTCGLFMLLDAGMNCYKIVKKKNSE